MLCCGRRKQETPEPVVTEMDLPRRGGPFNSNTMRGRMGPGAQPYYQHPPPDMVVQSDFRKVSGISSEIFNQIQAVENDHDATTAASLAAVEKKGEMLVRILDPRTMGRAAQEATKRFLMAPQDPKFMVQFIEIVKRPGQTLGLYLREGNCTDRHDGVFVSRIALESAVYNSGVLRVSDEILAVNLVDVTHMSLDDVVIIMSIPRRLVLTLRTRKSHDGPTPSMKPIEPKGPPVVIVKKKDLIEEEDTSTTSENGQIFGQRYDGPGTSSMRKNGDAEPDQCLFYNSQPKPKFKQRPLPPPPLPQPLCQKINPRTQTLPPSSGHAHSKKDSDANSSTWRPPIQPKPTYYTKQHHDKHEAKKKLASSSAEQRVGHHKAFPKTLESLAEKVHTFYSGPRLLDTKGHPIPGSIHASSSEKCLNLAPRMEKTSTGTLPRSKDRFEYGRLMRAGSEHLIPTSYSQTLKAASDRPHSGRRYDTIARMGSGAMKTRKPSCESFSDTEASSAPPRPSILSRQRSSIERGASARYSSLTRSKSQQQQQTHSLPRMRSGDYDYRSGRPGRVGRHKYSVRFERDTYTCNDSQEESDGAVSAPEMPSWKPDRRQKGRMPHSPSVFTAAEYKDWLKRTPSTSAIYEQLKRSREVLNQQRASRLTFSAECLLDEAKKEEERLNLSRSSINRKNVSRFMQMQSGGKPISGRLSASTRARMQMLDGRTIPTPSPARPTDSRRLRLLEIEPNDFIKYKAEKEEKITSAVEALVASGGPGAEKPSTDAISGLLLVHLLAGRGLKQSAGTTGRHEPYRDLYCVLECDRVHKARTVVRMGDQNFDWDETFELDLISNKELDFLVYSWDPKFRHKLCYRSSINVATLFKQTFFQQIALKMEPRGTIYLKLRYTNPLKAFQRTPVSMTKLTSRRPALFGVDLETTVSRENSGFNVPIIIKRCIDEIERRGLDIIGLYRLCGSATKKRTLRDSFERNPRLVDLTPDNVPDINVITGVLKDYLRELPDPLLPKGLYQMLLDALTVCLPDDPEGNAKLMFSILDCLPKFNKCTLIMVMDHFKLVLNEKEKNKMTAHTLASCFGPLLMCKTDDDAPTLEIQQPTQVMKYLLEIWPSKNGGSSNGGIDHLTVTANIGTGIVTEAVEKQ